MIGANDWGEWLCLIGANDNDNYPNIMSLMADLFTEGIIRAGHPPGATHGRRGLNQPRPNIYKEM